MFWANASAPGRTPQPLADAMAVAAALACTWFHDPEFKMAGEPSCGDIADGEVRRRIEGWQAGYDKEFYRIPRLERRYDLRQLPFWLQRALVERWERSHREWLAANPEWTFTPAAGYTRRGAVESE